MKKYEITTETDGAAGGENWCFLESGATTAVRFRIVIEVERDFLESHRRREFHNVGMAVAAELHELYRQVRHEIKHG